MPPAQLAPALGAIFLALCLFFLSTASAAELEAGFSWLSAQQAADGSVRTEATTATPQQSAAEALLAGRALDKDLPAGAAALAFLGSGRDRNTEFLARRVIAGDLEPLPQLADRARRNGGIGDGPEHESSVLATAYTVLAWAAAGDPEPELSSAAVGYLLARQQADGSWADGPNQGSVYLTALTSRALQAYRFRFQVAAPVDAATVFLEAHRNENADWGTEWRTAWALLALLPATGDARRYSDALTGLRAAQRDDGSWNEDVFTTALALQALNAVERVADQQPPLQPGTAVLSGRVTADEEDTPLSDVLVQADGGPDATTRTDTLGRFRLELPADTELQVSFRAEGFSPATQIVHADAGAVIDVGVVRLTPLPNQGRIVGAVTSSATGEPLPGAELQFSGPVDYAVTTGSEGLYEVALPAGDYDLTVSAPDHHSGHAGFAVEPGAVLRLSPVLAPLSQPPVDDTAPAAVTGMVVDGNTGKGLEGVMLSGGGVTEQSAGDGSFYLAGLQSGHVQLKLARDGYRDVSVSFTVQGGVEVSLGLLAMEPVEDSSESRLTGLVRDAQSGQPIHGARVVVGERFTRTGADGAFLIDGLTGNTFTLDVEATGFHSRQLPIRVDTPGTVQLTVDLEPERRGGMEIEDFHAPQSVYGAWEEVPLLARIRYDGPGKQVIRLYLRVYGPSGDMVCEHPATPVFADDGAHDGRYEHEPGHAHDHELSAAEIPLGSGEFVEEAFSWFTETYLPGDYLLELRVYQAFDGELLGARSLPIRIQPTQRLELVSVRPDPLYLTQGSAEPVNFRLTVQHRSNLDYPLLAGFQLEGPDGRQLHSDLVWLELDPEVPTVEERLEGLVLAADQPGEYRIRVLDPSGAAPAVIHGQSLHVAPGTRVEINQDRNPGTVAPDGDHRVNIKIRLEGKEQ